MNRPVFCRLYVDVCLGGRNVVAASVVSDIQIMRGAVDRKDNIAAVLLQSRGLSKHQVDLVHAFRHRIAAVECAANAGGKEFWVTGPEYHMVLNGKRGSARTEAIRLPHDPGAIDELLASTAN